MAQVRRRFQRAIVSCIVEARELSRVVGVGVGQKVVSRRLFVMSQGERAIGPGFDGDLSYAPQTRGQPLCERDFLRRPAHFKAREMR